VVAAVEAAVATDVVVTTAIIEMIPG